MSVGSNSWSSVNLQSSYSSQSSTLESPSTSSQHSSRSGAAESQSDQIHLSSGVGSSGDGKGCKDANQSGNNDTNNQTHTLVQSLLQGIQDNLNSSGSDSGSNAGSASAKQTGAAQPATPLQAAVTQNTDIGPSQQGHSADCGALASIDAIANVPGGTQALHSMIQPLSDGDVGVTFPGDPAQKTYDISQQDLSNSSMSKGDPTTGVLTLAMNEFSQDHSGNGIGNGSYPTDEMTLMTGKDSTRVDDPSAFASTIKNQLSQGDPVVAGATLSNGELHAVTVDSYDPQSDTVKWTNPWDSGQQYQQSLSSFVQSPDDGNGDFSKTTEVDTMPSASPAATVDTLT